ncbi:hypothetical protein CVT25_006081 [Psilocybe cyanescens]|uniref:FZ domain-containing protein n=1 Tax=Psilocybe cyanescens TaxID=93625 RepID=A0A409XA30_PSICY|nr:hypothetical protein CVT25_006081 [Psilocybe cyanescens]
MRALPTFLLPLPSTSFSSSGLSSLHTLPTALLMLLTSASLALAQSRTTLPLNGVISLNTNRLPKTSPSGSFAIPQQFADGPPLGLSIALCNSTGGEGAPRFFVTNASNWDTQDDPGPTSPGLQGAGKDRDTWEIMLKDGMGSWTGLFPDGGVLGVDLGAAGTGAGVDFDVGVSESEPIHQTLSALPLFGDTTANQALLFSAPFLALPDALTQRPTYPNYTLPAANMSQPALPSGAAVPNVTLVLSETPDGGSGSGSLLRTGCALDRAAIGAGQRVGTIASETVWARDDGLGWRMQWVVEGLTPSTNYTAYVVTDSTTVSGPIYFATKSAAFTCPLVHSLPYCPSVSYAVPLPAPPGSAASSDTYTDASGALPGALTTPLLSYLANFTTVLTTHACGRDWYSPVVGCDDCQKAYRAWLCAVSFVRCSEPSSSAASTQAQAQAQARAQAQLPISALLPQPTSSPPRNPFLPSPSTEYTALLPCIEQCYAVDRACPPFLGFKCPSVGASDAVGARASYGVGFLDGEDGEKGAGKTGAAGDRWGNVWCNFV